MVPENPGERQGVRNAQRGRGDGGGGHSAHGERDTAHHGTKEKNW